MNKRGIFQIIHPYSLFICIAITPILIGGCSPFNGRLQARSSFKEANALSSQGSYESSLNKYAQIVEKHPSTGDRALFEMGIIHAHPKNMQKDFQKAIECFQKITMDYPESRYRQDSEMMIFYINNVTIKDNLITRQQTTIDNLRHEVQNKENEISKLRDEIAAQQKKIKELEEKVFSFVSKMGPVNKVLIEKKARQLMLISNGDVIKTYKIALGGNPNGPKERQGDNKTPEGTYFIESRNKDSQYRLSLRISYPNENDRKRAKELGVAPGGDIMIHGIKNGLSSVGNLHAEVDWTKGCIAVTNEEIEEIEKLVPIGTVVEIRP